jgi:hypothetical protein
MDTYRCGAGPDSSVESAAESLSRHRPNRCSLFLCQKDNVILLPVLDKGREGFHHVRNKPVLDLSPVSRKSMFEQVHCACAR